MDPSIAAAAAASPLAKIMNAAGNVGYHWDLKADHIIWFGEWQKLFGAERSHPPYDSKTFSDVVIPEDRYIVFGTGESVIDRNYRLRLPDGRTIWVHEKGSLESDQAGPIRQCGMLSLVESLSQKTQSVDKAEDHSIDPLTKLPNREHMIADLNKLLATPKEDHRASCYMVVGIDKMAFVNEAVGPKSADTMLFNVGSRLAELMPGKTLVARVGGDLFGVLLSGNNGRNFESVAEKILQNFRDQPVQAATAPIFITVSIGVVRLDDKVPASASEVMIRAEQALCEARLRGRNVMVEYQATTPNSEARRVTMEMGERFKYALKNSQLRLAYQPIIDAATGQVVFYEALVRMFKEDGEIIPAADFVPAIEELGLALELDYHVLELVLQELQTYPDLRLAMNISGFTAARADWPDYLSSRLVGRESIVQRLIIEITETVAITDVRETQRFAETLTKLGGKVAIDDFGSGFTSIRHLRSLSLSIMKIDREMLNNLLDNSEQEHLVRMMIAIARGLGLKTVAEGVETEEVANWLQKEKVDMMQGYYFGRPSIERPWLSLKGADMSAQNVKALLGDKVFGKDGGLTEIHVGAFSRN